jgi:hypothetical protein
LSEAAVLFQSLTMAPLPHHSFDYIRSLAEDADSPLRGLKEWKPFGIDALGLVTLLGAEEINKSVGTLQRRRITECLPLLAAFVVAGDRFTEEQPGYSCTTFPMASIRLSSRAGLHAG